jgi:hypothetical protein
VSPRNRYGDAPRIATLTQTITYAPAFPDEALVNSFAGITSPDGEAQITTA